MLTLSSLVRITLR